MNTDTINLNGFKLAKSRINGKVRETPLLKSQPLKKDLNPQGSLSLKLENLQPTGSFKVRGALNTLHTLTQAQKNKGLITASGGNHGLAVAYAAFLADVPAVIYLPTSTSPEKLKKLQSWGAETRTLGDVWDDANKAALTESKELNMTYIHPFAEPNVIYGQGTISLEVLEMNPDIDVLLVAIGGGGLIAGVAAAAKLIKPDMKVIGVEPLGAPTHHASREAGEIVTLSKIDTKAGTLAPRRSEKLNFDLIQKHVDDIVLVSDTALLDAARWLWFELGIAAELSGAAGIAALSNELISLKAGSNVCSIICGGGTDGISSTI